ncbi:hypothetical protein HaLaN_30809 [Haematococcus lacustris]|uniref:Uncharacterized protein n=1 Tax=Haematococcus lacustris TaxID=44745 RepID=A0A6A0AI47_HAELA|nr:hypothetical protein HaLaN_30809 [Haematococcus lacustris]
MGAGALAAGVSLTRRARMSLTFGVLPCKLVMSRHPTLPWAHPPWLVSPCVHALASVSTHAALRVQQQITQGPSQKQEQQRVDAAVEADACKDHVSREEALELQRLAYLQLPFPFSLSMRVRVRVQPKDKMAA